MPWSRSAFSAGTSAALHVADNSRSHATARSGEWDLIVAPNQKKNVALKSPGKIEYYCKYHPNMVGQITVSQ